MNKRTPGPWSFRGDLGPHSNPSVQGPHVVENATGIQICILNGWRSEVSEGNARLIAATPLLLEALRDAISGWRYIRATHGDLYGVGWDRVEEKASAAIAAATGEKA